VRNDAVLLPYYQFFKERDIILAETGTSAFGIINVPFPSTASCLGE
jgi:TPP-dependent 2-oxoacid decarboxylase